MSQSEPPSDLLAATGNLRAVVERRRTSRRKVKRDRRKGVNRRVAFEVSPSGVAVAIHEHSSGQPKPKLIVERVPFPCGSGPAVGDWSDSTLRNVLSDVAAKYQLAGQAVVVGIGGDPCVTRVVVGENESVDSEVAELTGRANRYIGMGRGEKVSCETWSRIDAKRKRVWVTVAMRHVVDAIADAVHSSGMRLAYMQHTMLVLSEILSAHGKDTTHPVLLIVDELGRMDLGISYKGQLLLDYRPAMPDTSASEASIVQRHIKCLHRYIGAQLPDVSIDLSSVYVTGTEAQLESLNSSLDEQTSLHSRRFPLEELCQGCEVHGIVSEDPGVIAAIGLALHSDEEGAVGNKNNLMSTLRASNAIPWRQIVRSAWPVAASLLLVLGLTIASSRERSLAAESERRIESLSVVKAESGRARFSLERHFHRSRQVDSLDRNIENQPWVSVLWKTGSLLPHGVWLDSVRIDRQGETRIVGSSLTDEAIYEYIGQLKNDGVYGRVVLESTKVTRISNGPAYQFEISAYVQKRRPTQSTVLASSNRRRPSRG